MEVEFKILGLTPGFDGSNVRFTFGIPRGSDGNQGEPGTPGEVPASDLTTAIAGTSSNRVATLDSSFMDPDLDSVRAKLNELISALRR